MTIKAAALSLLCILAAISGARATNPGEMRINGHIDTAIAGQLHAAIAHGEHTIHVTSTGGDPLPTLALARDMRRYHVTLVVDGVCAGPCANYLFPAAAKRMVTQGALVIFSSTATSLLAMLPAAKTNTLRNDYTSTAIQEETLLSSAGVSQALLLEPLRRLRISCYSLTSRDASGKSYINYRSEFLGWVPSRAYLAHAGVEIAGFWPMTIPQFQAALKSAFPGGARGNIASFGPDTPASVPSLVARLKAVPQCDAGLPAGR